MTAAPAARRWAGTTTPVDRDHRADDTSATDRSPHWTIERITDFAGLTALAGEWDDLVDRCSTSTPFQRSTWLLAWWRHYGPPGEPCLLAVRRDGQLVAGAAVYVVCRAGARVLAPLGRGLSDITEFPVDDRYRVSAIPRLTRALLTGSDWQVLDLPEVRPGSAAGHLAEIWPLQACTTEGSICLEVRHRSLDDLVDAGPSRKSLRRSLRRARNSDIVAVDVPVAALDHGVWTLVDLHRRQWTDRGGNPEHLTSRFQALLTETVTGLIPNGRARLVHYRDGDTVVAAELFLVDQRSVYSYFLGYAPSLRRQVDVAALTIGHGVGMVGELDRVALDLLRGEEPYKYRWRCTEVQQSRHLLIRSRAPAPMMFVAAVLARSGLRRHLRNRHPELHSALGTTLRQVRDRGTVATTHTLVGAMVDRGKSTLTACLPWRRSGTARTRGRPSA